MKKIIEAFVLLSLILGIGFELETRGFIFPQKINSSENLSVIALTFDDGPNEKNLPLILELLEKEDVKATFFFVGWRVLKNRDLAVKTASLGHEIANHSFGHERLDRVGEKSAIESVNKAQEAIENATGRTPKFFRPPFWMITKPLKEKIESRGLTVMTLGVVADLKTKKLIKEKTALERLDLNTEDYEFTRNYLNNKNKSIGNLIDNVKRIVKKRDNAGIKYHILVFHELEISTKALEELIPHFKSRRYKFVILSKYFEELNGGGI